MFVQSSLKSPLVNNAAAPSISYGFNDFKLDFNMSETSLEQRLRLEPTERVITYCSDIHFVVTHS